MANINVDKFTKELESQINAEVNKRIDFAKGKLITDIIKDTDEFVPYDTGKLSKSVTLKNDVIEWTADYAEYVYNMPETNNFNKTHHPKATSNWIDASIAQNYSKWLRDFEANLNRG